MGNSEMGNLQELLEVHMSDKRKKISKHILRGHEEFYCDIPERLAGSGEYCLLTLSESPADLSSSCLCPSGGNKNISLTHRWS